MKLNGKLERINVLIVILYFGNRYLKCIPTITSSNVFTSMNK